MPKTGLSFEQMIYLAIITALVTLILNSIFHTLKNKFDWFQDTKKFKREYYYKQLEELYIPLYAVVAQSEYLRRLHSLDNGIYDESPFIEINTRKRKTVVNLFTGNVVSDEVTITTDDITEFNKEKLSKLIIEKGVFASQELLKLAVAYRYTHKHYKDETLEEKKLETFQKQELYLINQIVRLIVKESNEKLKACSMPYNKDEIELSTMLVSYTDVASTVEGDSEQEEQSDKQNSPPVN